MAKPTTSWTAFSLGFRAGIVVCSQQLEGASNTVWHHACCCRLLTALGHLLAYLQ